MNYILIGKLGVAGGLHIVLITVAILFVVVGGVAQILLLTLTQTLAQCEATQFVAAVNVNTSHYEQGRNMTRL